MDLKQRARKMGRKDVEETTLDDSPMIEKIEEFHGRGLSTLRFSKGFGLTKSIFILP